MAAADRAAIEAGTPAEELMDRAGRAVARAVLDLAGRRYGLRVVVLCGKGSNGGDGVVAARALTRFGASVRVVDMESLGTFDVAMLERADVIVDALFGTGFRGAIEGAAARAVDAANRSEAAIVAADIPSGVDGKTGLCSGPCIDADITVAMGAQKIGTAIGPGALRAGTVVVADIGIPVEEAVATMIEPWDVARALPGRAGDSHKRSSGSVVVVGGSDEMTGAPLLTARAALRSGSGYVNLVTTPAVSAVAAKASPELVIHVEPEGFIGPDALDRARDVVKRADAVAIGPGLGTGSQQRELVERALGSIEAPVVADADALNLVAENPGPAESRSAPLIMTPHPAELARLLGTDTNDVQEDRLGSVAEAARRFGCTVVLKGHRSLIANPIGDIYVNPTGGPELATAGTGDVLTGVCAAYVAAGLDPTSAAWAGAYVHGAAGSLAAEEHGTNGVVAWDVAENLGRAAERIVEGKWF